MEWHVIRAPSDVPADRDVRLAVIKDGEVHALIFPCRRSGEDYVNAKTKWRVEVYPTHWQEWVLR
jgi:hypothetical protein